MNIGTFLWYVMFCAVFLSIPYIFRLFDSNIEELFILTQRNKVSRMMTSLLFIFCISSLIAYWMPGVKWADSPYLLVVMVVLSTTWSISRMFILINSIDKKRDMREHNTIETIMPNVFLKKTLGSFFPMLLTLLGVVVLIVLNKGREAWVWQSSLILFFRFS